MEIVDRSADTISPIELPIADIQVKEPTLESLTRKKREYKPPAFMTVAEAAGQLLRIVERKRAAGIADADLAYTEASLCVGVARVGHETQQIVVAPLDQLATRDLGGPLHSLVLPSRHLHPLEIEYMQQFSLETLHAE